MEIWGAIQMYPSLWEGFSLVQTYTMTGKVLTTAALCLFVAASHQTRLDTSSKARRPIKVGIKGKEKLETSRDSNPAAHQLVLLMLGSTASGVFRVPPRSGMAFPTTSGLYCLEVYWQLHRGFPRTPSVGCGFPYHIWSLTLWESAGNYSGTQTQLS